MNLTKITLAEDENKHKNKCSSCTLYIVLFSIIFTISIGTGTYFIYYKYKYDDKETMLKKYYLSNNNLINLQMGNIEEINIKNLPYYFFNYCFFNDMINIGDFDSSLAKIDKKSHKSIGIYYIGCITIKKLMIMKIFLV